MIRYLCMPCSGSKDHCNSEGQPDVQIMRHMTVEIHCDTCMCNSDRMLETLTRFELRIVSYFVRHTGRIITSPELLSQIWGNVGKPDAVRRKIEAIRIKLGDDIIITVRNKGWVWGNKNNTLDNECVTLESI